MKTRITQKQLDTLVETINTTKGHDIKPYTKGKANIGTYYIDSAYGGVKLVQLANEHGAIRDISRNGYGTKRELFMFLQGMLA